MGQYETAVERATLRTSTPQGQDRRRVLRLPLRLRRLLRLVRLLLLLRLVLLRRVPLHHRRQVRRRPSTQAGGDLEAELRVALEVLRRNCPPAFWEKFRTWQKATFELNKEEFDKYNASISLVKPDFLKPS